MVVNSLGLVMFCCCCCHPIHDLGLVPEIIKINVMHRIPSLCYILLLQEKKELLLL